MTRALSRSVIGGRAGSGSIGAALFRRINVVGLLTMAGLVAVWQALVVWGVLDYQFLPAPSEVWAGGREVFLAGELVPNVLHTLRTTLLSWVAASVFGIALGLVLGLSTTAWRYSMATIEVLRSLPAITFVPVAVLILGFSVEMELVIAIYVAQWPVLLNTIDGVRGVKPALMDVAKMLHMSAFDRVRKLILPAAMPLIVVGLRLALALSLVIAVVAEMVGNPAGLGYQLVFLQAALQPDKMFAYVVVIGLLGVAINAGFLLLTRFLPGGKAGGSLR